MTSDAPHRPSPSDAVAVDAAITSRRAIRAFKPDPVPLTTVEHILDVAARAPSGTNMQPWQGYVLVGERKERLSRRLLTAHDDPAFVPASPYRYYPDPFFEPYLGRRRKVGWDLYGVLGIQRGETARMHAQHGLNLTFFGAPVGLVFTIDKRLELGSWLDYGMFLQNIMVAARGHGLDTCPQAAFAPFDPLIRDELGYSEHEVTVCGMALGHAEESAPEHRFTTEREPARRFMRWPDPTT